MTQSNLVSKKKMVSTNTIVEFEQWQQYIGYIPFTTPWPTFFNIRNEKEQLIKAVKLVPHFVAPEFIGHLGEIIFEADHLIH